MLGTRLTHHAARRVITGAVAISLGFAPLAGAAQTVSTTQTSPTTQVPIFSRTQPPEAKPDNKGGQQTLPELGDPSQTLLSASQFWLPGPPHLTSPVYARDFIEVKGVGGKVST